MKPIKIVSGIVMPKKGNPPGRPPGAISAALRSMKVGDSFVRPRRERDKVIALARYYRLKVTTRMISKDKIRIWKVKDARQ